MEALRWAKKAACPSPTAKLLLLLLADYAGPRDDDDKTHDSINHSCFVSTSRLAEDAGISPRAVTNALKILSEAGLIARIARFRDNGSQRSSLTTLHMFGPQRGGERDDRGGVNETTPLGVNETTPLEPSLEPPREPKKASPSSARTRVDDGFVLSDELKAWREAEAPNTVWDDHLEFLDYWRGAPGVKGKKADWAATWRNWMRRANERRFRRPVQQFKTANEKRQDAMDDLTVLIEQAEALVVSRGGSDRDNAAVSAAMEELKRTRKQGSMARPYIEGVFHQLEIT